MQFHIIRDPIVNTNRRLIYRLLEQSFDIEPAAIEGFSSFLINYINLEVNNEGKVLTVWGFCPKSSWKETKLQIPNFIEGRIYFREPQLLKSGTSIRLFKTDLPISFDTQSNWLCIGENYLESVAVKIFPGIIICLNKNSEIDSIWLKPDEEIQ